ncbi:circadian clock protein KaiA [Lusitaniella coriacea]|uniref:circadian clock protein KaiA n=1 Tax=Lusitaniella coriacea TaxID=1983105 RepID=UPI003CEE622D
MSDNLQDRAFAPNPSISQLVLYILSETSALTQSLPASLDMDRYRTVVLQSPAEFIEAVERDKEEIDCLILEDGRDTVEILGKLRDRGLLLPAVMLVPPDDERSSFFYHTGEVRHPTHNPAQLPSAIDRAIAQFLKLAPSCALPRNAPQNEKEDNSQNFLLLQQHRLSEKLKERLGYLGVYYKRNSQDFWRNLSRYEKKTLLDKLRSEYREIILNYFSQEEQLNQSIDQFVNQAFFADLSVSQLLEIHMELIDEFSQQLKLEGRSDEILLDYRLALIDIIAHLCEMYRRSIPREDLLLEL